MKLREENEILYISLILILSALIILILILK